MAKRCRNSTSGEAFDRKNKQVRLSVGSSKFVKRKDKYEAALHAPCFQSHEKRREAKRLSIGKEAFSSRKGTFELPIKPEEIQGSLAWEVHNQKKTKPSVETSATATPSGDGVLATEELLASECSTMASTSTGSHLSTTEELMASECSTMASTTTGSHLSTTEEMLASECSTMVSTSPTKTTPEARHSDTSLEGGSATSPTKTTPEAVESDTSLEAGSAASAMKKVPETSLEDGGAASAMKTVPEAADGDALLEEVSVPTVIQMDNPPTTAITHEKKPSDEGRESQTSEMPNQSLVSRSFHEDKPLLLLGITVGLAVGRLPVGLQNLLVPGLVCAYAHFNGKKTEKHND